MAPPAPLDEWAQAGVAAHDVPRLQGPRERRVDGVEEEPCVNVRHRRGEAVDPGSRLVGEAEDDEPVRLWDGKDEPRPVARHRGAEDRFRGPDGAGADDEVGATAGQDANGLLVLAGPDPGRVDDVAACLERLAGQLVAQGHGPVGERRRAAPRDDVRAMGSRRPGDARDESRIVLELAVPVEQGTTEPG